MLLVLALTLCGSWAFAGMTAAEQGDPLFGGKLYQEVSLSFQETRLPWLLKALARMGEVPFVLDFEDDPSLRVTFKAEHVPLRTVLQSLADTYGLEYSRSEAGIVVRRKGMPSVSQPVIVGAWVSKPGPHYKLGLEIRDAEGTVSPGISMTIAAESVGTLRHALPGAPAVTTFDRDRLLVQKRPVGAIQLTVWVRKETSAGLDLLLETVTTRPVSEDRYAEEHAVTTKIAGPGETVLYESEDGTRVVLKSWSRLAGR